MCDNDSNRNGHEPTKAIGYVDRRKATRETYQALGFKCGLEIHQQLKTDCKLFCRCPAGEYQAGDDYDAQLVRHMRPTLSELGEYDGTALMEFRTRKNITYRIKSRTACTYDIDDTPPFPLNRDALRIAVEVSLLLGTKVVGELHITRKQYPRREHPDRLPANRHRRHRRRDSLPGQGRADSPAKHRGGLLS